MSRTLHSIRNTKYGVLGQLMGFTISFFARIIFVRILSAEYLGLNGLFSNILSILSFAELGVGTAIVYSMYKPLAEKDEAKLKSLVWLYRRAYITIGVTIAIMGSALTPFLGYIVKYMPNIPYIQIIYLMFVANSAISYFFSYKRSLIIADQNGYIITFYHYLMYFFLNIIQILTLLLTHNYIFYLGLQLMNTLIENIIISRKANQLYPFLKEKGDEKLDKTERSTIVRNVKAMICHKIGSIAVTGTDNILISKFVGVVSVGMYSNYLLIITALKQVIGTFFQALTASIGNLRVIGTNERSEFVFNCINLLGFWIYAFASICLINLFNPFIQIWLGETYLFPMSLVVIIIINFYLTGMRQSVLTFRDAFGLYWYDRYKPLFEAGVNLVASVALAKQYGTAGILIGTAISTLTTCFWVEPYVLYKYGFKSPVKSYFIKYALYTVLMLIVGYITSVICAKFSSITLVGFMSKMIVCVIIPNVTFAYVFWRKKEFQHLLKVFKNYTNI